MLLQVLRLARNRLQSLPEAIGCYGRLQILDCSGNRLTSVPRVVGKCTALQQLLMASNRLRGLTSGIGNLLRLQVLDLSHNQYRHLPTMTGDLTQLQVGIRQVVDESLAGYCLLSATAGLLIARLWSDSSRTHVRWVASVQHVVAMRFLPAIGVSWRSWYLVAGASS